MNRRRLVAAIIILVVDVGLMLWGAMAALLPEHLPGPGGAPILPAGYEGFTGLSWEELAGEAPQAAAYVTLLFRVYGAYCFTVGLLGAAIAVTAYRRGDRWAWWALLIGNTIALGSAMRYDWLVHAIGPFELTEYLGLVLLWVALAVTAPLSKTQARHTRASDA